MNFVTNPTRVSIKKSLLRILILVLSGLALGLYLFFSNPWLKSDFYSDSYSWFLDFSRAIFQPQSVYYAESILLPLIAKITGASKSLESYKTLCAIFTISILPIVAICAQFYFRNFYKTFFFIALFVFSYQYLQYYILGFPDPLTIVLLVSAVFQRRLSVLFILLVLAMLSHFSMAALSVVGLMSLVYFSPKAIYQHPKKMIGTQLAAILIGKLLLLVWFYVFHYQLQSRLDWALSKGYIFFWERYEANVMGFWMTPGGVFLTIFFLIAAYFLIQKRYAFVLASVFALAIAYVALFWTVDGLRVFSVVIAAPFTYLLMTFINSLSLWKAVK